MRRTAPGATRRDVLKHFSITSWGVCDGMQKKSRDQAVQAMNVRTSSSFPVPKMPCNSASFNCEPDMHGSIVKSLSAAALAVCIIAGSASAQGKGHEKEHGKGEETHQEGGKHQDEGMRQDAEEHRADRRHMDAAHPVAMMHRDEDYRKVPPGLAKKGGMPPGQAKKYYRAVEGVPVMRDVFVHHGYTVVRTQPYGNSEYVYYRLANGPIQRAVIVPGTAQLGFQNVPQALIQEILSRLY
ncbi:hypothetical protein BH11GEM2_BH11GEM2_04560 [soil metagenome]